MTALKKAYRAIILVALFLAVLFLYIPTTYALEAGASVEKTSGYGEEQVTTDFVGPMLLSAETQPGEQELTPTPGWELFGTCEWQIDDAGCLTIRPVNNGNNGELPYIEKIDDMSGCWSPFPWLGSRTNQAIPSEEAASIKTVRIVGNIVASNSLYGMFKGCYNMTSVEGFENLNTSNVEDMSFMFMECSSLDYVDVSSFDTSKVKYMVGMFMGSWFWDGHSGPSFTTLDLSSFNTSSMIDMSGMFYKCEKLESLDLSSFDTSKVKDMFCLFKYCYSLKNIPIDTFDTSNVVDMGSMFAFCTSAKNINLRHFNTSNVKSMSGMFSYCNSLESLDLSSFNTSNVINMGVQIDPDDPSHGMFEGCESLKSLNLSNFDTSKVYSFWSMFDGCSSLKRLDLSSFDTSLAEESKDMFDNALAWVSISDKFTLQAELPDKTWYNTAGQSFTPATIPAGIADVYQTGESLDPDPDPDPDNYYLSTTDDSDLKGCLVISDPDVAKELDGCYLRINKSEKMSDTLLKRNLLNFLGTGSRILDILDVDIVDASGNTIPWSNPDHGITVQFEKDYLSECEDKNFSIGIYYVKSSSEFEEHKAYWNQDAYEISFDTTHFSTYAVTASPIIENTPPQINKSSVSGDPKANKLAQTGDMLGFGVFAVVELIFVAAGFALIARSRMSRAKER